jgi:hypothetical protein
LVLGVQPVAEASEGESTALNVAVNGS